MEAGSLSGTSQAGAEANGTNDGPCFGPYQYALWNENPVFHSPEFPVQTQAGDHAAHLSDRSPERDYGLQICRLDESFWF